MTEALATEPQESQVVCLLDVLGFESILRREGLAALHRKYASLIGYVTQQTGGLDVVPTPDGRVAVGWLVVGNAYFSDSLLFWTHDNPMALPSFTNLVADAICFGIETELPLRGAIAVGEAILDRSAGVFLGLPLVEIARTESAQQWVGASFGPSFRARGRGFHLNTVLPYKSQYKVPANSYTTGIAVDWPRRWRETRKSDPRPLLRGLDREPHFSSYYRHTLDFVDFSGDHHDWFLREEHLDYG